MPKRLSVETIALEAIEVIYASAFEDGQWQRFVDRLCHHFPGFVIAVRSWDERASAGRALSLTVSGLPPSHAASYNDYYVTTNPWALSIPQMTAGRVLFGSEMVKPADFYRSEFYNDWAKPLGVDSSFGYLTEQDPARHLLFASLQREAGNRHYDEMERLIGFMGPHLQRAMRLNRQFDLLADERHLREAAMDRFSTGIVIVDDQGRLLYANQAADEICRQDDGITFRRGQLRVGNRTANSQLAQSVALAGRVGRYASLTAHTQAASMVRVERPSGLKPYAVMVAPMPGAAKGLPLAWRSAVMLFINDPELRLSPAPEMLRSLYGLTPAESRLVIALLEDLTLDQISAQFGISTHTIKVQIRQVFAKTGTSRQSELIGRVLHDLSCRLVVPLH